MIYEFYNPTNADTITIRATLDDDYEGIITKIRAHADDLEYRQFFLKKALKKSGVSPVKEPRVEYPDLMTAEQVAEYLQISPKTVRNKTSSGEIKSHLVAGVRTV
ncbi:MAG: helix-turn-helix domain-containing protein [Candidatus Marinimicrobia bacterium]|nr:helix-turn-helix domain-containing protein [Candidatus Neomarinimicrobiota bacterium]